MKDWFGKEFVETKRGNPLIAIYGEGPLDKICSTCTYLYRKKFSKTYFKCRLRKETNGAGSDHRARWPACGKYTEDAIPGLWKIAGDII